MFSWVKQRFGLGAGEQLLGGPGAVAGDRQSGSVTFTCDTVAGGANVVLTAPDTTAFLPTSANRNYHLRLAVLAQVIGNPAVAGESFTLDMTAHQPAAGNVLIDNTGIYSDIITTGAPAALASAANVVFSASGNGLVITGTASGTIPIRYTVRVDWQESISV